MSHENVDEILMKLASDEIPADIPEIAERLARDFTRNTGKTIRPKHPKWWEIIMKSKTAKLAAAIAIAGTVLFGAFHLGDSTGGAAWGALVQRTRQAHDDHMARLRAAVEAKDTEKVEHEADLLGEFWQNLNWLARAQGDPQFQSQLLADAQARIEDGLADDEPGAAIFLAHAGEFLDWLGKIEDEAWIDETIHVCKQLEEYLEEVRDGARSEELGWPYIDHCLPSVLAYCQWFEQLPWDDPTQAMTARVLLAGIRRDLEMAKTEVRDPIIRGGDRWVRRALEQAQKHAQTLASDLETESPGGRARVGLSRKLARGLDATADLVTYAGIAAWDIQQTERIASDEASRRVLEREFGGQGPLRDYLLDQIDTLLGLCQVLVEDPGPI